MLALRISLICSITLRFDQVHIKHDHHKFFRLIHTYLQSTPGIQTFLSEGRVSFYATVRGPDILRNVIVLGYVTFYQINKCS